MKAWTDYPLCESALVLGTALDTPDEEAPIREVKVLGWDGNKYARVRFEGDIYVFKVGYLYTEPYRMTMDNQDSPVPNIDYKQLPIVDVYSTSKDAVHWDDETERWVCDCCNQPVDWS
jgi:hypothetical protein